jgi:hypothetical protein
MNESKSIKETKNNSTAAILKTADINSDTREYLVLIGELHDINTRFETMIVRDWGEENVNNFAESFRNSLTNTIKEVEKAFLDTFLSIIT